MSSWRFAIAIWVATRLDTVPFWKGRFFFVGESMKVTDNAQT